MEGGDDGGSVWNPPPHSQSMTLSPVFYLSSMRTTICDVTCVCNQAFPLKEKVAGKPSTKSTDSSDGGAYRLSGVRAKLNVDLKRDRIQRFHKITEETLEKNTEDKEKAATVQRSFREQSFVPSKGNMIDELCELFSKLPLKPMDGLNVEKAIRAGKKKS